MKTKLMDRVAGLVAALLVVAVAVFAYRFYKGDLTPGVQVSLKAPRTGILLDPGSNVSVRGVKVGTVRSVKSENGQAVVRLSLEPEQAKRIPANVVADLRPTTLFGAKYVDLVMPEHPAPAPIASGDVIPERRLAQEADQVFQNVMYLLADVQPQKINNTLSAVSGALSGRGEQLGRTIEQFNTYLTDILPSVPQLNRDLALANRVMPAYRQVAPDLITAMDNWRTTSATLTGRRAQLTAMLDDVTDVGGQTTALMIDIAKPLTDTVTQLAPTSAALARYSPMLTCLLQGMVGVTDAPGIAGPLKYPGIWGNAALLPRARPYQYPADLPEVGADAGPYCYGLPLVNMKTEAPVHYDFDVGRSPFKHGIPRR